MQKPGKEPLLFTAYMAVLQANMGGKHLEEAEIHEIFGAFQAEDLLFHQVLSELLDKCAFNFFIVF